MSEVEGQMMASDGFPQLLADIRTIIVEARRSVYAGINAVQIDHNWNIGRRIVEEEQGGKLRAEYGKGTIAKLSAQLCAEFGEGYSERYIWEFRRFYATFPDVKILHTRVQNLSWSHFRSIMRLSDPVAREWYIQEAQYPNAGGADGRGCKATGDAAHTACRARERWCQMKLHRFPSATKKEGLKCL